MAVCEKSIGDESEVDVIDVFLYWSCVFGWYEVHRCRLQLQEKEKELNIHIIYTDDT